METMGKDLIQLCDQLETHGLVDYQMGIWEEEILSGKFALFSNASILPPNHIEPLVLGQCLDLMDSRPDLHHIPTRPEATAVPRP